MNRAQNDSLFFDPDADEPTPTEQDKFAATLRAAILEAGLDPSFADACDEVGFILTDDNRHLFSAHDLEAWETAVAAEPAPPRTGLT